jgi:hypothetical protein
MHSLFLILVQAVQITQGSETLAGEYIHAYTYKITHKGKYFNLLLHNLLKKINNC